jgi:glycolate oxidase FAD binding subunit
VFELDADSVATSAAARQIEWGRKPLPLSATLYRAGRLHVRLSGSAEGVKAARTAMGGETVRSQAGAWERDIWAETREQTLPFFQTEAPLWRISLPAAAPALPGEALTEWGGALRWLTSDEAAEVVRGRASALGGHATLFRGHDGIGVPFQPLSPALFALHRRLKHALDPRGIFNPGKLYEGL